MQVFLDETDESPVGKEKDWAILYSYQTFTPTHEHDSSAYCRELNFTRTQHMRI